MMSNKNFKLYLFSCFILMASDCFAAPSKNISNHPFYVGFAGGYGSTTWQGLVPAKENQNAALMLSTPIKADEGGVVWGLLTGYEFTPFFAIEASYMHFPDSNVHFDALSLFSFYHDGQEVLSTKTETVNVMAKLMVPLPHTEMKIFSSVGVGSIHRKDIVLNRWNTGPAFAAGINRRFTDHIMGEVIGNFTVGYGESQLSPVDTYFPFLYSVAVRLMYRV